MKREFLDLFRNSGWSQAEAARRLGMTRGGVNGIVTRETVPSLATVKLFRLVLQNDRPGIKLPKPNAEASELENLPPVSEKWIQPLLDDIRLVKEEKRNEMIRCIRQIVRLFQA
ncbi:MAG TPA: helix-turn-helix domain-containing protein [Methylomirabilota bacterium]|nr:helix-turn-helix domain-containing protein [Methylomirabilota bacterium]